VRLQGVIAQGMASVNGNASPFRPKCKYGNKCFDLLRVHFSTRARKSNAFSLSQEAEFRKHLATLKQIIMWHGKTEEERLEQSNQVSIYWKRCQR